MFDEALQEMIKRECRDFLYYFNYTDNGELASDPDTAFYTYDGDTQHYQAKLEEFHEGYLKNNKDVLERVAASDNAGKGTFAFNSSYPVDIGMKSLGTSKHPFVIKEK